jgi:predicted Zn-dependent protease
MPDLARALPVIDSLIAERPRDAYFYELKGQMLFETQRAAEALAPYRKSVELMPGEPLLRISLAQVEIELGQRPGEPNAKQLMKDAVSHLEMALKQERDNGFLWHLLAVAYGSLGDDGMASLAMAEKALLSEKLSEAKFHAARAEKILRRGSPAWLQATDILERAAAVKDEKKYR